MPPDQRAEAETAAALRRHGARFAFVHGSRASPGGQAGSDLDVAAWWGADAPAPWDVRVPEGVDLVVLDEAPLELSGRVALHGRVLFDDDLSARVRWQAQTRLVYLDEQDRQRRLDRVLFEGRAVVDERRVRLLLQRVTDDLSYLRGRAGLDQAVLRGVGPRPSRTRRRPGRRRRGSPARAGSGNAEAPVSPLHPGALPRCPPRRLSPRPLRPR